MERPGPLASHQAMDIVTQEIRKVLKEKRLRMQTKSGFTKKSTVPISQGASGKGDHGAGSMHDNLILPDEPCGFPWRASKC